jgi:hypothetical protein
MLTDREKDALRKWYRQDQVKSESKRLIDEQAWEALEEHLHMRCLLPLGRHGELPDFMCDDQGGPLFPKNLNPRNDLEKWQDAIEVAWEVMEKDFGLPHDEVHRKIASVQKDDWDRFVARGEARKAKKGSTSD